MFLTLHLSFIALAIDLMALQFAKKNKKSSKPMKGPPAPCAGMLSFRAQLPEEGFKHLLNPVVSYKSK